MAVKKQTLHFENDEKARTASVQLIMDNKMDSMPLSYQCIIVQAHARIFLSQRQWDAFKRCKTGDQQLKFLYRNQWTYEPGKMLFQFNDRFTKIMLLHGIDDPMKVPAEMLE